ncbi:MAG: hypothetical protein DCC58_10120, partial [Chloroflexi bacterium]
LGLTLANIVGNKASHNLTLAGELHIAQTADGTTRLTWDLLLTHHGNPGGNQFYNGFHRTWLALYLPTGSTVVHSDPEPTPPPISDDPRALGYHLELYSGESLRLRVTFDLPAGTDSLRLRRQPGANPIALRLSGVSNGCAFNEELELAQDALLDLTTCEVQQPAPRSTEQR